MEEVACMGKVEEQVFHRRWRKTSTKPRAGLSQFKTHKLNDFLIPKYLALQGHPRPNGFFYLIFLALR